MRAYSPGSWCAAALLLVHQFPANELNSSVQTWTVYTKFSLIRQYLPETENHPFPSSLSFLINILFEKYTFYYHRTSKNPFKKVYHKSQDNATFPQYLHLTNLFLPVTINITPHQRTDLAPITDSAVNIYQTNRG